MPSEFLKCVEDSVTVSVAIAAETKVNRSCVALVKRRRLAQDVAVTVREGEHESGAGAAPLGSCCFQQSSPVRTCSGSYPEVGSDAQTADGSPASAPGPAPTPRTPSTTQALLLWSWWD